MQQRVPELSLADYTHGGAVKREEFRVELMRGLQRYGFIILRDHPVSMQLLDEAYRLSAALFAQPEETKQLYVGGPRGYVPFRTERAKNRSVPDLKEFWQIGPERDTSRGVTEAPNIWPAQPPGFKQTLLELFGALQDTGRIILEALAPGLSLPQNFFAPLIADSNSVLRLLHYPPVPADADPDSVRAAALGRCPRAVRARVQGRSVRARDLVEAEDAALTRSLPRARQRNAVDVQRPVRINADRGALVGRLHVERAVPQERAAAA